MVNPDYEVVTKVIKNHFSLGNSEAKLFSRLMTFQKFKLEDVKKILKEIKEKKANSRAYQLVNALKKEDLIEEIRKSNPKTYRPLHPRVIFDKIKKEQDGLEDSFGIIEQAYETFTEENGDDLSCFDLVSTENMIVNKIQSVLLQEYNIQKVVGTDPFLIKVLKGATEKDYTKVASKSNANYVVFGKEKTPKIIFSICSMTSVNGTVKKEGIFIYDENFASAIK